MAKCKCSTRPRIVSNVVQSMKRSGECCIDVCANPICCDPTLLGLYAPLIYDEIGINLCATFDIGTDISTTYPTASNASVRLINATYAYGDTDVRVEALTGRPNCYLITLSNIILQFAIDIYDSACRLLGTVYQTATYLPSDTTSETYNEDTNPASVELEIFAPYGLSYDIITGTSPALAINFIGAATVNNMLRQGVNLFGMAKILNLDIEGNTVTVGVTLVLQSMYFAGYKVASAGKIDIPKGSIVTPDNSDCMKFVAGELLNLAIRPLDLGAPSYDECSKNECCDNGCKCNNCGISSECNNAYNNNCSNNVADDTVVITPTPTPAPTPAV